MIRVMLVEDHTIVRKGIKALLKESDNIEVVAEAQDGQEAIQLASSIRPDVIVMDITMPRLNGIEATRQIRDKFPDINVVILTMYADEAYIFQSLRAGVSGYLLKHTAPQELVLAINAAFQGGAYLSPSISRTIIEEYLQSNEREEHMSRLDSLTNRERQVLQLIAEGFRSGDIANQLFISEKTVRTHRARLMNKLNIHSVAELTQFALRHGVVAFEE